MSRAIFSGNLNFGMVSIGVKLYTAQKDNSIKFNFLCPNGHKVEYKRYCPICKKEIPYNQLLKGYYISKSVGYITFTQEEIKKIQQKTQKVIQIIGFTDNFNVDYLFLDKTYYLLPQKYFEKPYFLLKEILTLTNKSAIAKITLRNKERLCLIRAYKNGLTLTTLYNIDDVVDLNRLMTNEAIEKAELSKEEVELAKQLVRLNEVKFYDIVKDYKDSFREIFKQILEQKMKGKPIKIDINENVAMAKSLIEQLKMSIEQGGEGDGIKIKKNN